jgi:hypothetical protein
MVDESLGDAILPQQQFPEVSPTTKTSEETPLKVPFESSVDH